ncbi:hypothetical protein BH09PLA1_BH09PLA1_18310 [soil metagenome]
MVNRNVIRGLSLATCVAATVVCVGNANADILPGSLWPNGTLENASTTQADAPSLNNTPGGAGTWRRGGADFNTPNPPASATIDFWDNAAGTVSGTHALRLTDNTTTTNGEWFVPDFDTDASFVPVPSGATLRFRFFWNYDTHIPVGNPNGADMRVTIRGTDGIGTFGLYDFLANGSTGGQFVVADFTRTLPAGTTGIRMNIASGGDAAVTGFLAVDDISVVVVPEPASAMAVLGLAGVLIRRRRA